MFDLNQYYDNDAKDIYISDVDSLAPAVVENGCGMIKAGYGGDDDPFAIFPSLIGKAPNLPQMVGLSNKDTFVGDEALYKKGILTLEYPIEFGLVKNWDSLEKILHFTFYNGLRIAPEERDILLTSKSGFIVLDLLLALLQSGRTTGTVISSGEGVTSCISIYNGYFSKNSVFKSNLAGKVLNKSLMEILNEFGLYFSTLGHLEIVRDIKEKICYVALDFEEEIQKSIESNSIQRGYQLPNGDVIELNDARFKCSEALFQPHLIGMDDTIPIHKMIYESIMKSPIHNRKELFNNIILVGGTTLLTGIIERLNKEISSLVNKNQLISK
ncbi:actin-7-related [Anaeramoeba ignava]|uniref:Actin-7-related n=1 Tax=Anaeramoeba ignava TaxID=1746090 RepID=A0A9Q0LVW1_ANAIG|nr:actin-7-related [Anaeramoeba ignava]